MLHDLRISRRGLVQAGAVSFGGAGLANLLTNEAAAGVSPSADKLSVLLLFQPGGPSHLETWDMKPDAPVEYRGEFTSIPSNLPGYRVGEHLTKLSQMCDKLSILRSVHHNMGEHSQAVHTTLTGYAPTKGDPAQEAPSCGSIIAKELGWRAGMPGYIAVQDSISHGRAGYLGVAYDPFETFGYPTSSGFKVRNLRPENIKPDRIDSRKAMLSRFDTARRDADVTGDLAAMDTFRRQAFELATSPEVADAFDLNKEDDKTRERYDKKSNAGQSALLGRRLIERGARFVTVAMSFARPWDSHEDNFTAHRLNLPAYDHTVSAVIEDLEQRGILDRTLVIVAGEFGRTPRINARAGRDHWPSCYTVVMAGGGVKRGFILGSSDALAELPKDRPIGHQDVLATMYHLLGIDYTKSYLNEANRPVQILNVGQPIGEILL